MLKINYIETTTALNKKYSVRTVSTKASFDFGTITWHNKDKCTSFEPTRRSLSLDQLHQLTREMLIIEKEELRKQIN